MKNKPGNPFVTGGYMGPEYFCDRQQETGLLRKAIASNRSITLISQRRIGKTGLLKHVKYLLDHEKNSPMVIYADLLPTMNGNEMLNILSSALLREKQHEKNIFEKLLTLLSTLRPKITYDPLTGQPALELKVENPAEIQSGFSQMMKFLSEIRTGLVIMLDEFQQISRYPEKNIEAALRSVIQSYPGISFIFSGSSKHMLESMFGAAGRPFYQSTELLYLHKIPEAEYSNFIRQKFAMGNKKTREVDILRILDWTRMHTFYVQHVCNLLYECVPDTLDIALINQVFYRILVTNEPLYAGYRNLLPAHQYKLLQAIAAENGISRPTGGEFIQKYGLTSASSVATSLKALADKEMIVKETDTWQVYDVFFSRWLAYHFGGK